MQKKGHDMDRLKNCARAAVGTRVAYSMCHACDASLHLERKRPLVPRDYDESFGDTERFESKNTVGAK